MSDDMNGLLRSIADGLKDVRESVDSERDARLEDTSAQREAIAAQREASDILNRKMTLANRALRRSNVGVAIAVPAALVAVLASVLALAGWLRLHAVSDQRAEDAERAERERVSQLVVTCLNLNTARVDREARDEQLGGVLLDALASIASQPASPEAAAQRQQSLDKGKATFEQLTRESLPASLQPQDCSPEVVTTPTTFAPSTTVTTG